MNLELSCSGFTPCIYRLLALHFIARHATYSYFPHKFKATQKCHQFASCIVHILGQFFFFVVDLQCCETLSLKTFCFITFRKSEGVFKPRLALYVLVRDHLTVLRVFWETACTACKLMAFLSIPTLENNVQYVACLPKTC